MVSFLRWYQVSMHWLKGNPPMLSWPSNSCGFRQNFPSSCSGIYGMVFVPHPVCTTRNDVQIVQPFWQKPGNFLPHIFEHITIVERASFFHLITAFDMAIRYWWCGKPSLIWGALNISLTVIYYSWTHPTQETWPNIISAGPQHPGLRPPDTFARLTASSWQRRGSGWRLEAVVLRVSCLCPPCLHLLDVRATFDTPHK